MSTRVLIAYDGSTAAEAAVGTAGRLFASGEGRLLTIVDVPPGVANGRALGSPLDPQMVQQGIEELSRALLEAGRQIAARGVATAERAGLTLEPLAAGRVASTWHDILAVADDMDAGVIVCGSRGRGGIARSLLGSTSTGVLHHATRPVLVVPGGPAGIDGPALIAYDGSAAARAAVAAAGRLLPDRPAVIVHVWYSAVRHTLTGRAVAAGPIRDLRELAIDFERFFADEAEAMVEEGVALAREAGLAATGTAIESDSGTWRAIAQAAADRDAAVIVSGSRGRSGVAATVLGSVSSGLVHNAQTPALIIRPLG